MTDSEPEAPRPQPLVFLLAEIATRRAAQSPGAAQEVDDALSAYVEALAGVSDGQVRALLVADFLEACGYDESRARAEVLLIADLADEPGAVLTALRRWARGH